MVPARARAAGRRWRTARGELIARAIYLCDEEGHIVEEKLEPGHEPGRGVGDQLPEKVRALMAKVLVSHFMQQRVV
jgi:hypothetical protein